MKILVTGGAGYLGSVLVPKLLAEGHTVTVLDSFMYRQASLADACPYDGFTVVRGDARDASLMRKLLAQADAAILLAAIVGAPLCGSDPLAAKSVNQDAVEMACGLAAADQMILLPATNSGYGVGEADRYCTEETPLRPISLYGRTKVAAEEAVLSRRNGISFRLATAFGMSPRMRVDLLVNDFVYRAVMDRSLVIFEGKFRRNFIHVQDIARAFIHALEHFGSMRGMPYNLGLDEANLSKLELAHMIQSMVPGFAYAEAQIGEDPDKRDYIVSNEHIRKAGFVTQWGLERGIRELMKGYVILRDTCYRNVG